MAPTKSNLIKSIVPNAFQIVVLLLAVGAAFYIGKLSTEVEFYKEGMPINNQLGQAPAAQAPEPQPYQPIDPSTFALPDSGDHVRGNSSAKIAIIEYSDFDCPFCGSFHETAQQIVDDSNGEVQWIYRHFPLDQLHPDAFTKSAASECAYLQGGDEAFWAFTDEIYNSFSGSALEEAEYREMASDLGFDATQFMNCINNGDTADRVKKDMEEGTAAGVRGTPGNYIVNFETETIIPLRGAEPLENVRNVIDGLLE